MRARYATHLYPLTYVRPAATIVFMRSAVVIYGFLGAFTCMASIAVASGLQPVPSHPEAGFAAKNQSLPDDMIARGQDGVKVVACKAAIVTGVIGSHVRARCASDENDGDPSIDLVDGAFHVHVGGRPVKVRMGDTTVLILLAQMIAVKTRSGWVVQIKHLCETGSADIQPPRATLPEPVTVDPSAPLPDGGDPATTTPIPIEIPAIPIRQGQRFRLSGNDKPSMASRLEKKMLGGAIGRLLPTSRTIPAPLLSPREVEDPEDFAIVAGTSEEALGELEIEAIEVDVGCVEICVD